MIAGKQMDMVLGVDIHIVFIPTPGGPVPTPLPHPHIGILLDPLEYLPIIGNTVYVNGAPGSYAGSAGIALPPHIPFGTGFVKPVGNENEIFMGSATVLLCGEPMSSLGHMCLSCSCIGAPPPPRPKKKGGAGLMLPTSAFVVIPTGPPIIVGGPPTVSMLGLAMSFAGVGFGWLKKTKMMKKASSKIHTLAAKVTKKMPKNMRNKIHKRICDITGHPVDIPTGKVFTDQIDFEMPGPIPLTWERTWYSTSPHNGPVGHGWHHSYDMSLKNDGGSSIEFQMEDGRNLYFPFLEPGETHFNQQEKILIERVADTYKIRTADRLYLHFDAPSLGLYDPCPLQKITDKAGHEIVFKYKEGLLTKIIDSGKREIYIENNAEGKIETILLPHPKGEAHQETVKYTYDEIGNLTAAKDGFGNAMLFEYERHLLTKETDKNGLSFSFEYDGTDENARCIRTWGSDGIYDHKLTYDLEAKTTIVENSLGHKTTNFWNHDGLVFKKVDPLKRTTIKRFGTYMQLESETDSLGRTTRFMYTPNGDLQQTVFPDGGTVTMAYKDGLPTALVDQKGASWGWNYDEFDRLAHRTDPEGNTTTYEYLGKNLSEITNPAGATSRLAFDPNNNLKKLIESTGAEYQWHYDERGRVQAFQDPKNNTEQYKYDRLDRLIRLNEADGNVRNFTYDKEGNITGIKDKQYDISLSYVGMNKLASRKQGGTEVKFHYDTEENLKSITNEAGDAYTFELNEAEEVIKESGFDGLTRHYHRDKAGRVSTIDLPTGSGVNYVYDQMDRILKVQYSQDEWEEYDYDATGALQKADNKHVKVGFERDKLGRVTKEIQGGFEIASTYDKLGNRLEIKSSLGEKITYHRNNLGDIESVEAGGKKNAWNAGMTRDVFGQELDRLMPGNVKSSWKRDSLGRPVKHETTAGGKRTRDRKYVWGVNYRLSEIIDEHKGAFRFQHDDLGNLTGVQKPDGTQEFRMPDAVGNLFKSENQNDRTYGKAGQLLTSEKAKYSYDGLGNMTSKVMKDGKVWKYEWNKANRLRKVTRPDGKQVVFSYDALGRRISKNFQGKTTRWVWDGNFILHEWIETAKYAKDKVVNMWDFGTPDNGGQNELMSEDAANAPPGEIVIGNRTTWVFESENFAPMAMLKEDASYSIVNDHLGTPCAMYSHEGEKVWSQDLSIYGEREETQGGGDACPFRYPGQYEDVETGLYYNRFRYYAPEEGIYLSQDPIRLAGNNPTLYGYVEDPHNYFDPFGLEKCGLSAADKRKMGPSPSGMQKPHRHHIVREKAPKNWKPENSKHITDSQDILKQHNIDLNKDLDNFTWATNGNGAHTTKAAEHVANRLKAANINNNKAEVIAELNNLGSEMSRGIFF